MNETEEYIQKHLDYLVLEGVAVKMKNGNYRLKTSEEIEVELEELSR